MPNDQLRPTSIEPSAACAQALQRLALDATEQHLPKLPTRTVILEIGTERQVRTAIAAIRKRMQPASPEQISRHFLALAVIYPTAALTEEQANLKFQIFCADLAKIPDRILLNACAKFRRAINPPNRFFPAPGELLALAESEMREMLRLLKGFAAIERALDAAPAVKIPEQIIDLERMREIRGAIEARGRNAG